MNFRALRADEIECRVHTVSEKGIQLLLYKDARCDMNILDETVGPLGWQRKHEVIDGKEFCTVSIIDPDKNWVSKQDCGTESNTEKEKGETSDAFKRACFNWGIGRELYTKIFIFIKVPTKKNEKNSKWEMSNPYEKFCVNTIETDNKAKKILHLEVSDKNKKIVFTWDNKNPPVYAEEDSYETTPAMVFATVEEVNSLYDLAKEKKLNGSAWQPFRDILTGMLKSGKISIGILMDTNKHVLVSPEEARIIREELEKL